MIHLHWVGPYATGESPDYPNYRSVDEWPGFAGLYCWCVCVGGVFLPTYIGKGDGGVVKRVDTEIKNDRKGKFGQLLDVQEFKAGRRLVLRPRFSDASEKRGENKHVHAQHLAEYEAAVDANVLFFARRPEPCDATTYKLEQSTIARVQSSGLDVVPSIQPERGHYELLLCNKPATETVEIIHHCKHVIRGLTTGGD